MKEHFNLTKGLPIVSVVLCLFTLGCKDHSETEKLRAEVERLKEESETQRSRKQAESMKDCALKGSVYIITKEGTNIKFGLVPIAIADSDKFKQHLDKTFTTLVARCQEHRKAYDPLVISLSDSVNKMRPCLASFERAQAKFSETLGALATTANVYATLHRVDMRNGANRGQYQIAASAFRDALAERTKAALELKPQFEQLKTRHLEVTKARYRILSVIDGQMDAIFVGLPGLAVLKTDANGEFQVKLPRNNKITVAARAERPAGKETEHYYWLTEFTIPDKDEATLLLSNDTLQDGIPEYSDRLSGFLPKPEPEVPTIGIEDALATWVFTPSLAPPQSRPALQPGVGTIRSGDVIILGTRLSAEILDESGKTVGSNAINAGEKLEIEKEDEQYVFFKRNNKSCRVRKDKLPKQGAGN